MDFPAKKSRKKTVLIFPRKKFLVRNEYNKHKRSRDKPNRGLQLKIRLLLYFLFFFFFFRYLNRNDFDLIHSHGMVEFESVNLGYFGMCVKKNCMSTRLLYSTCAGESCRLYACCSIFVWAHARWITAHWGWRALHQGQKFNWLLAILFFFIVIWCWKLE